MITRPPCAFGYVRCSHPDSVTKGLSPTHQKRQIEKYRRALGVPMATESYPKREPHGIFADYATSAWSIPIYKRPAGAAMRKLLRPGDHVLLYSIDRGFRSVKDFAETVSHWLDNDINVHLVSQRFSLGSSNGRLLSNILAAFSQWKSDMISERTREGLARRRGQSKVSRERTEWQSSVARRPINPITRATGEPASGMVYSYSRASHVDSVKSGLGLDAPFTRQMSVNNPGLNTVLN